MNDQDDLFRDAGESPSKPKERRTVEIAGATGINLPFSLYAAFEHVAGISIKLCGTDGQPLPGVPAGPLGGPCGVLACGSGFAQTCAENHAAAVETAIQLQRPYIFNCHVRLAAWAVPILQNNEPVPAAIICGGGLLSEPDVALIRHVERVAVKEGVDPAELADSLNSVPVLSRERIRATADFLFRMSASFASYASLPGASEVAEPPPPGLVYPVTFPPRRRKETKKAKQQRSRMLELQNIEAEVVRLLRERKPDAALDILVELLGGQLKNAAGDARTPNLNAAETFARLFRQLAGGERLGRSVYEKQSRLVTEIFSQKTRVNSRNAVERLSRTFISIAEEMTGPRRPRQVRAIQKFLEKNLSKKLTLGAVGKKFGLKEKALDALIRKHCTMAFTDYVASLRIAEAKRLLRSTDLGIGQIARRTGFKDQSYFTKVFKSRLGLTPTEFKNSETKHP